MSIRCESRSPSFPRAFPGSVRARSSMRSNPRFGGEFDVPIGAPQPNPSILDPVVSIISIVSVPSPTVCTRTADRRHDPTIGPAAGAVASGVGHRPDRRFSLATDAVVAPERPSVSASGSTQTQ